MSEFSGDVSPTKNDHGGRELSDPHDGVRRVVLHVGKSVQIGNDRPAAGADHKPVSRDHARRSDVQSPRSDEVSRLAEQGDRRIVLPELLTRCRLRVDPPEDAIPDVRPPSAAQLKINTEPRSVRRNSSKISREDQHLGRYATDIEADATESATFHHGNLKIPKPPAGDGVRRSAADDAQIKMLHVLIVPGRRNHQQV